MGLNTEQKKELESKISDGITPPCPICGSSLNVGNEQVGKSGANGRNYSCTKDRLKEEEGSQCDLEPGIAYVDWLQNIKQVLRNRTIQFVLVGITTLFAGGGIANVINDDGSEQKKSSVEAQTKGVEKNSKESGSSELKDSTLDKLTSENENLKKQIESIRSNARISEFRWKLGLFLTGYSDENLENSKDAKEFLKVALSNNEIASDKYKGRVLVELRELTLHSKDYKDWKELLEFVEKRAPIGWENEYLTKAIIHYNLGQRSKVDSLIKGHRETSLQWYYCEWFRQTDSGAKFPKQNFEEVVKLIRALHRPREYKSDSLMFDLYFNQYDYLCNP